jgi:hypothetical protein
MSLTEALEKLQDLRAQAPKSERGSLPESAVVSQNEAALKQLQAMMGGIR